MTHLAGDELVDEVAGGDEGGVRVGRLVDSVVDQPALEVLADARAVRESCAANELPEERLHRVQDGPGDGECRLVGMCPRVGSLRDVVGEAALDARDAEQHDLRSRRSATFCRGLRMQRTFFAGCLPSGPITSLLSLTGASCSFYVGESSSLLEPERRTTRTYGERLDRLEVLEPGGRWLRQAQDIALHLDADRSGVRHCQSRGQLIASKATPVERDSQPCRKASNCLITASGSALSLSRKAGRNCSRLSKLSATLVETSSLIILRYAA